MDKKALFKILHLSCTRIFAVKRCGNLGGDEYTVLGNALAILAGLELDKEYVCEKIVNGELFDCSLSMKIFKYDALLATDKEKYQEWVLNEIRREYGKKAAFHGSVDIRVLRNGNP